MSESPLGGVVNRDKVESDVWIVPVLFCVVHGIIDGRYHLQHKIQEIKRMSNVRANN